MRSSDWHAAGIPARRDAGNVAGAVPVPFTQHQARLLMDKGKIQCRYSFGSTLQAVSDLLEPTIRVLRSPRWAVASPVSCSP